MKIEDEVFQNLNVKAGSVFLLGQLEVHKFHCSGSQLT